MRIPGLSFSLKRAVGITKVKQKISRKTGVPMTKQGLERKIGGTILKKISKLFVAVLLIASAAGCANVKEKKENKQYFKSEMDKLEELLQEVREVLSSISDNSDLQEVRDLMSSANSEDLEVGDFYFELTPEQQAAVDQKNAEIRKLRARATETCEEFFANYSKSVAKGEILIESQHVCPVYLKRGMKLNLNCECDGPVTINLYNADSRKLVKSFKTGNVNEEIAIANTAIYLVEFNVKEPQYCYLDINYTSDSMDDYLNEPEITVEQVECAAGSFRAKKVPGIRLRPIFEEPHKITVRSKGKNFLDTSSPYRSVTAVRIPAGSSDILYRLRISTTDSDSSDDGEFCKDVSESYKKVKFLGLPLYESTKSSSSIFREVLNDLYVSREEKAYCNFYVFNSQGQAKKFQDNAAISGISYNMDYSCTGTQSRNERIPVKGQSTVYLGFENTRQMHDIFIWLEVLATVPTDVYYTDVYKCIQ